MFHKLNLSLLSCIFVSIHCDFTVLIVAAVGKLNNQIASWDTKFEMGTKAALLQPFSPVVIASDDCERIR